MGSKVDKVFGVLKVCADPYGLQTASLSWDARHALTSN